MLLFPTSVSMIIMSILSDAQHLIGLSGQESKLNQQLNFAKWLISQYKDTTVELDNDELTTQWDTFSAKFPIIKMQMNG